MDGLCFGDYVDLDEIQVALEIVKVEEAIQSKQPKLEYFAQYSYIVQYTLTCGTQ